MVMSASRERQLRSSPATRPPEPVLWHEVECGAYRADLALWRELADDAGEGSAARILEIGAGTGRVALDLARAGHCLTALDIDPELLGALRERAGSARLETVCDDARTFTLQAGGFDLCIAPMQTVQLLDGSDERRAFLRRAREHMRPGGVVACAIVGALQPFNCDAGDAGPAPDLAHLDGEVYASRVVRVLTTKAGIVIERERTIRTASTTGGPRSTERDAVELALVSPLQLEREGARAGLTPLPRRSVPATHEHVGSAVVMLRA
jgi:SAM-dependent methyltransferase